MLELSLVVRDGEGGDTGKRIDYQTISGNDLYNFYMSKQAKNKPNIIKGKKKKNRKGKVKVTLQKTVEKIVSGRIPQDDN